MNKSNRQKLIPSTALLVAATASAFAQRSGITDINEATSMVSLHSDPSTKLIYAIGVTIGFIRDAKMYGGFPSEGPDASKTAVSWFGAYILLIVVATILRSFLL